MNFGDPYLSVYKSKSCKLFIDFMCFNVLYLTVKSNSQFGPWADLNCQICQQRSKRLFQCIRLYQKCFIYILVLNLDSIQYQWISENIKWSGKGLVWFKTGFQGHLATVSVPVTCKMKIKRFKVHKIIIWIHF